MELGIGMGLNLPHYDPVRVEGVWGVDPSAELRGLAERAPRDPRLTVRVMDGTAEALPFDDDDFDTVLCTYTLCSVHAPLTALAEARRVLKPGGRLLFCEHGLAPDPEVAKWQRRIEPVWKRLAGGCRLTRPVAGRIAEAGFALDDVQSMYLPGAPRIAGWNEWGAARPV